MHHGSAGHDPTVNGCPCWLYLWLIRFPLAEGRAWAWWLLAVGGTLGFLTFLSYLGTGYLDSWHGLATLVLLPLFVLGLARSRPGRSSPHGIRTLLTPGEQPRFGSRPWLGRALLLHDRAGFGGGLATTGLTVLGCVWCGRASRARWEALLIAGVAGIVLSRPSFAARPAG